MGVRVLLVGVCVNELAAGSCFSLRVMAADLPSRLICFFFFSSRRRHTRWNCDWSSDVCSSDLRVPAVKLLFALKVTTPFVTEKDVKVATPGQDPVQAAKGAARLVTSVSGALVPIEIVLVAVRSEERRVGKECRCGGATEH